MDQNTWIYILIGVVIVVGGFFVYIRTAKTKPTKVIKSNVNLESLFNAIGGKENMVSCAANGSKVTFTLNDIKLISQDALKGLGASGIVASKNKVTVIFGKSSEAIVKEIEQVQ